MTAVAQAHGMDGTLVMPDWPPLMLHEVRELLSDYAGCAEPLRINSSSPRPFAASSVVSAGERHYFVKRHARAVRDPEGLLEEHRFIAHLRANGIAVPRVLANLSGKTAVKREEWTYEVHDAPDGVDIYKDAMSWTPFRSVHHAHSAGGALARLHSAAAGFDAPARAPRPLVASFSILARTDPAAALKGYLAARPTLSADEEVIEASEEALELLAPFHTELTPLLAELAPLWTHNDLHASNLLWSDLTDRARATWIIDFGLADRTNAVHDLAHAIERNIVEWLALVGQGPHPAPLRIDFAALDALLSGYEAERGLSAAEAAALAPMTALCHAEFALSEIDYFLGVLRSREKTTFPMKYLVDHARWFRSADGARLLDALRRWAESRRGGESE